MRLLQGTLASVSASIPNVRMWLTSTGIALAASGLLRDRVASSASIHLTDTYVGGSRRGPSELQ